MHAYMKTICIFRCLCAEKCQSANRLPYPPQHIPISTGVSCWCFQAWRWMTTAALAMCPCHHGNGFSADAQGAVLGKVWVVSSIGFSTVEATGLSQVAGLLAVFFVRNRFFIVGHHGKALGQPKCLLQNGTTSGSKPTNLDEPRIPWMPGCFVGLFHAIGHVGQRKVQRPCNAIRTGDP